jgi:hypothetical protein
MIVLLHGGHAVEVDEKLFPKLQGIEFFDLQDFTIQDFDLLISFLTSPNKLQVTESEFLAVSEMLDRLGLSYSHLAKWEEITFSV